MSSDEEIPSRQKRKRTKKYGGQPSHLRGPHLQNQMAETAEKRRVALSLRRQGATYEKIAAQMGLSTAMAAWRYVNDAIKDIPKEEAKEIRAIELQKLDDKEVRLNLLLADPSKKLTVADAVKLELALLKIQERRAKFLGLDAAISVDANVNHRSIDVRTMTDEQLARLSSGDFGVLQESATPGDGASRNEAPLRPEDEDRGPRPTH